MKLLAIYKLGKIWIWILLKNLRIPIQKYSCFVTVPLFRKLI